MKRKIDMFDKYMKYSDLNDNKVTVTLGLSVGTIGKSRKPGRDLSDNVIGLILNQYTNLNRIWLMTGKGEMLNASTVEPVKNYTVGVPYYNVVYYFSPAQPAIL